MVAVERTLLSYPKFLSTPRGPVSIAVPSPCEASASYSDRETDGVHSPLSGPCWKKRSSAFFGLLGSPHLLADLEVIVSLPRIGGHSLWWG